MPLLEKELVRCEQCGAPLESGASALGCLNCLLLGGLSEPEAESRRFQHYEVCLREDGTLHELGRGAMGITYRARDINLDSPVALKVISASYSNNPEARERFRREARAAAQLRHPNVASVFHFGETADGQCFYAMEMVEGETLEARVLRDGLLEASAALEVVTQVARALLAAEAHQLVHRDLKPSNLMILPNESGDSNAPVVKVIDFGLAKAVVTTPDTPEQIHSAFSGTPDFASPEQLSGGAALLDIRSDIYSLGATLWYLLSGHAPFSGRLSGKVHDQTSSLARLEKVPPPVVALLRSMLAVDPADRPQSARELLAALSRCRESVEAASKRRKWLAPAAVILGLLVMSTVFLTSYLLHRQHVQDAASTVAPAAPEKSIAVLPFQNLGADKENSYFAGGVQDEILSDLAKIADLKVISRTSVLQYQGGAPRNLREIGKALGVVHVLEGSVQRVANRVRVNAQLVDTRTDAHLWAETYDRDLADVFAIQTEIAQKIADQLQAKISPPEKAAIEQRPTKDLVAYDLYVRAKSVIDEAAYEHGTKRKKDYFKAIEWLNQAIARDPAFLLAYCRLAEAHDELYLNKVDHTPARLELAKSAINSAFRLNPDSGEAHLALAKHLYHGYLDYDHARDELDIASRTLPNNARISEWSGYIDRRQNRWHDAVRDFKHAMELDPRNVKILTGAVVTYELMREYEKQREVCDRLVALEPTDIDYRLRRAWIDFFERADARAVHAVLGKKANLYLALSERDAVAAEHALAALHEDTFDARGIGLTEFRRGYLEGLVARMKGDAAGAQAAFSAVRVLQEKAVRAQPDDGPVLCVLGLIDAGLGRKEDALREGRRALELAPLTKDYLDGADVLYFYAVICAWTGERDLAIEQLETLAKIPAGVFYGDIRLNPYWDSLRGDPRFEKIVASLAPKSVP